MVNRSLIKSIQIFSVFHYDFSFHPECFLIFRSFLSFLLVINFYLNCTVPSEYGVYGTSTFKFEVSFLNLSSVLVIYCYVLNFLRCSRLEQQTLSHKISECWIFSSTLAGYFWIRIFHEVTVKLLIGAAVF